MRPGSVEVADIRAQYPLKLLLMQDEQVIKTLSTHTPEQAFTDGIGMKALRCRKLTGVSSVR